MVRGLTAAPKGRRLHWLWAGAGWEVFLSSGTSKPVISFPHLALLSNALSGRNQHLKIDGWAGGSRAVTKLSHVDSGGGLVEDGRWRATLQTRKGWRRQSHHYCSSNNFFCLRTSFTFFPPKCLFRRFSQLLMWKFVSSGSFLICRLRPERNKGGFFFALCARSWLWLRREFVVENNKCMETGANKTWRTTRHIQVNKSTLFPISH